MTCSEGIMTAGAIFGICIVGIVWWMVKCCEEDEEPEELFDDLYMLDDSFEHWGDK